MTFIQSFQFSSRICIMFAILATLCVSFIYFSGTSYQERYPSNVLRNCFIQPRATFVSKLRWCKENPFVTNYDQNSVMDSEEQWYLWDQNQLTRTFDFLKKYSQSPKEALGVFPGVLYPIDVFLPCPYNNNSMKRYGKSRDAGKLLCGVEMLSHNDTCVVYSLGSAGNFEFEESILLKTHCTVHTFDCTSFPPKQLNDRLHFHKICLGENSPIQHHMYPQLRMEKTEKRRFQGTYMTFDEILKLQNHSAVHVLKMDIEGGEYSVFTDLLKNSSKLNLPYQISFESHWWNHDIYHAILHIPLFSQLWRSGYRLLQYELNGGDQSCAEWTFIRLFC